MKSGIPADEQRLVSGSFVRVFQSVSDSRPMMALIFHSCCYAVPSLTHADVYVNVYIYIYICVCVSTPVPKGSFFHKCRGVQHLWSTARNEAKTTDGKGSRTLDPVPAMCFTSCDPNFPWFASMAVLHDTSHQPTAALHRSAADFECQIVFECSCQQCSTIRFCGLMHLSVPSPSFPTW